MLPNIQKEFAKYVQNKYVVFGITLNEVINKNGDTKKDYKPPGGWQNSTLNSVRCYPSNNGLAMVTGKRSGVFVIDIDVVDDWNMLLEKEKQVEPITPKAISGNNGIHFYFKYTENISGIVTNAKSIKYRGKALGIDVRTNGGMIIVPPTAYPTCADASIYKTYTWERSIYDCELLELPKWLHDLLYPVGKIIQPVIQPIVQPASETQKGKRINKFGFPESDDDKSRARTKNEIENEIENKSESESGSDCEDKSESEGKSKDGSASESEEKIKGKIEKKPKDKTKDKTKKNSKKNSNKKLNKKIKEKDEETKNESLEDDFLVKEYMKSKNKYTKEDIQKIVSFLDKKRIDNYDDWVKVGMCLKNIDSKYFHIWDNWSKKSKKYVDNECFEKWTGFVESVNGLNIGSLIKWVKEDNIEAFTGFTQHQHVEDHMNAQKEIVASLKNNVELDTLQSIDCQHFAHLKNRHCPIANREHKQEKSYLTATLSPFLCTIYCQVCGNIYYPCKHMPMTKNEVNVLFPKMTMNNNQYQNCTFKESGKKDCEDPYFDFVQVSEDSNLNQLVYESLKGKPYRIAKILYYLNKNDYNYDESIWYKFKKHYWQQIENKCFSLRNLISEQLGIYYSKYVTYHTDNNDVKQKDKIQKLIDSLDESLVKNNIINELTELYCIANETKFSRRLDSNPYLIGFENGVFDLEKMEFRNGKPEDCINMNCGYDFTDTHTEHYEKLLTFLEDIQPVEKEREYLLTYLSGSLIGKNRLEFFTILTGKSGRNGKSKLVELIAHTLGEYYGPVSSKLFTRPRPDANSPDPGLLSLLKKRIVVASEPEKGDKLNSGFIKFITGNDIITLRNCHDNNMRDFKANFITLLICNEIPEVDEMDPAFSKRLRCINFPTEFTQNPIKPHEKLLNPDLNLIPFKQDFMLLLIDYYKKLKYIKLETTEDILKWTNGYKEENDLYLTYLNERTKESEKSAHTSDLFEDFKQWFRNNNPHEKIPNHKTFVKGIHKHKEIHKSIKINNKVTFGIKHIELIEHEDQNEQNK